MRRLNLKTLSFDDLVALRDNAEALIAKKVAEERKSLEDRLSRLSRFAGNAVRKVTGSSLKGRKAEPKYRNPANPDETWAGRGMKPRWLQALMDEGHSMDEFAIPGAETGSRPGGRRAAKKSSGRKSATAKKRAGRKARKTRKAA